MTDVSRRPKLFFTALLSSKEVVVNFRLNIVSQTPIKNDTKKRRKFSSGRTAWRMLSLLPFALRAKIIRRLFSVDLNLPSNLVFKKAETQDELEQAFRVAYDGFRDQGLVAANENRIRLTKYHALPTSIVLIAKIDEEVIATMSILSDSPMGLPMEALWDLGDIKRNSGRCAEVSTLAIKREHRSKRGQLLLPLCKFLLEFCKVYLGVDTMLMAVHPEIKDFYRSVLLFNQINDGEIKSHDFVQGASAVGLYLKIDKVLQRKAKKIYHGKNPKKNFYRYFFGTQVDNFIFPKRKFFKSNYMTFSPNSFEYFFQTKTDVVKNLTNNEKSAISNAYFLKQYQNVIGPTGRSTDRPDRSSPRFSVFCEAQFYIVGSVDVISCVVLEASRYGMRIRLDERVSFRDGIDVAISLRFSPGESAVFHARVLWSSKDKSQIGLAIVSKTPDSWMRFFDHLELDLVSQAHEPAQKIKRAG